MKYWEKIITAVIAAAIFAAGVSVYGCDSASHQPQAQMDTSQADYISFSLPGMADVIADVKPSVVAINTETLGYNYFFHPVTEKGAGSGWILSDDGDIVTNYHVVADADTVTVTLDDGRVFQANKVTTDPLTDLAVIEIKAENLPALQVGDSDNLRLGDWVVAIGNSLGRGVSASQGIVSSNQVSLAVSLGQTLDDLIQTDAAINPGNSGGPLLNMSGEVIGITSAKVAEIGVEGMGYAISSNQALPIIDQLIQKGYVVRPSLGVSATTVTDWMATIYRLPINQGAMITEMVRDGPADKAGLKPGDVITEFDGTEIHNSNELAKAIISGQVGQTVEVAFWRGNSKSALDIMLQEIPPVD